MHALADFIDQEKRVLLNKMPKVCPLGCPLGIDSAREKEGFVSLTAKKKF